MSVICQDKLSPQTVDPRQSRWSPFLNLSFRFIPLIIENQEASLTSFLSYKFSDYLVPCFFQQLDSLLDPPDHARSWGEDPVLRVVTHLYVNIILQNSASNQQ